MRDLLSRPKFGGEVHRRVVHKLYIFYKNDGEAFFFLEKVIARLYNKYVYIP